jgi:hypothetical protein
MVADAAGVERAVRVQVLEASLMEKKNRTYGIFYKSKYLVKHLRIFG